jgi:hypothetical protein
MRLGTKLLAVGLSLAAACLLTGCGGVNASHSVSPMSFLLPGLLKANTPKPPPGTPTNSVASVTSAVSFWN